MRNRIQHLRRDERGMTMAFVAMGFMAFLTATTLAIDVAFVMSARSQAQNAAATGHWPGRLRLASMISRSQQCRRAGGLCRDFGRAGQYDDRRGAIGVAEPT